MCLVDHVGGAILSRILIQGGNKQEKNQHFLLKLIIDAMLLRWGDASLAFELRMLPEVLKSGSAFAGWIQWAQKDYRMAVQGGQTFDRVGVTMDQRLQVFAMVLISMDVESIFTQTIMNTFNQTLYVGPGGKTVIFFVTRLDQNISSLWNIRWSIGFALLDIFLQFYSHSPKTLRTGSDF